ncbi:MAG TPA: NTP transferase domain-containing protein [Acetobacteraceae bacterium]|nr:NTP transferase domain-containing protein [Acetobacteraceae bacterium]
MKIAGLALAGGGARRLGGSDKTLLTVGGRPMLAWVIAALGVEDVAISANGDPARFAAFGCPVLPDGPFAGQGPLAGLLAGLDWAAGLGAEALLTAPGDTPFLPHGLAQVLQPVPSSAASNGRRHHLVATWPVACRGQLRARLASSGPRNVELFAADIGMRYHDFGVQAPDPFANVNTQAELEQARQRAQD